MAVTAAEARCWLPAECKWQSAMTLSWQEGNWKASNVGWWLFWQVTLGLDHERTTLSLPKTVVQYVSLRKMRPLGGACCSIFLYPPPPLRLSSITKMSIRRHTKVISRLYVMGVLLLLYAPLPSVLKSNYFLSRVLAIPTTRSAADCITNNNV